MVMSRCRMARNCAAPEDCRGGNCVIACAGCADYDLRAHRVAAAYNPRQAAAFKRHSGRRKGMSFFRITCRSAALAFAVVVVGLLPGTSRGESVDNPDISVSETGLGTIQFPSGPTTPLVGVFAI